jgi:hypothetical protein
MSGSAAGTGISRSSISVIATLCALAAGAACAIIAISLLAFADEPEGWRHAAPFTGRLSFGLFLIVTAMTATSNDAAVRALGPRSWKRLHTVGIYWIWFMFLETYAVRIARGQTFYMIFALAALVGMGLRITARARPGTDSRLSPLPIVE